MHKNNYRRNTLLSLAMMWPALAWSDTGLEEVIVTAEKREASLQSTPIAITALGAEQMKEQGIFGVEDFRRGAVPQLQVQDLPINPWTLNLTIRGIGNLDVSQLTRESPIAVYVDSVYLGRAQGLAMDVADLERIEILRGPQGTLFGRNAVGGALSLVTRKPSGEFGFSQALSFGNYGAFRALTRVDLPQFAGISAKIDLLTSERDGLVKNTDPNSHDFSEMEKRGGRLALRWQPSNDWTIDYSYDRSDIEGTVNYGRYEEDPGNVVGGAEPKRMTRTRIPTPFVEPSTVRQNGHALTVAWDVNELTSLKWIAAYRDLEQRDRTNFAGAFAVGWFSPKEHNRISQDQFSNELQLIGKTADSSIEYVAGLFHFKEDTEEQYQGRGYLIPDYTNAFPNLHIGKTIFVYSQDLFGIPSYPAQFVNGFTVGLTGDVSLLDLSLSDARTIKSDAESSAIYSQVTWTPTLPALQKRLHITGGVRYSKDEKSGTRPLFLGVARSDSFDFDEDHVDYAVTLAWDWTDSINTYVRYATAYQGGGANIRSASFQPFDSETAKSIEAGLKSEFWQNRIRLNLAVFSAKYEDLQLDFLTPEIQTETINAVEGARVDGLELEIAARVTDRLLLNLNYNYLDWKMPLQPNTTVPGSPLERFEIPQTPEHAGTASFRYTLATLPIGELSFYGEVTSRSNLYSSAGSHYELGDYTMFNARITLAEIGLGNVPGKLEVSLWGYNLGDVNYAANIFSNPPEVVVGQNEPRTYGIDFRYNY